MATEVVRKPSALVPSAGVQLGSSLAAGQLAGLVMAVVLAVVSAVVFLRGVLFPVQLIASLLLGHDALTTPDATVLITGLLFHQLGPSLGWSLVYFAMVMFVRERLDLNRSLMIGFLIGIASMVVDVFLIGPALQQVTSGENLWMKHLPRPWDWAGHMVYGVALGFFYWAVRSAIESRRGLVTHEKTPRTVTADETGVHRADE